MQNISVVEKKIALAELYQLDLENCLWVSRKDRKENNSQPLISNWYYIPG